MSGQRGSEERQKKIAFPVRLDDEQHARLQDVADEAGCSRAEVLRRLVAVEHQKIIPTRRMVSELSANGNNLNQIARALNVTRAAGIHAAMEGEAEDVMAKLRTSLDDMTLVLLRMRS